MHMSYFKSPDNKLHDIDPDFAFLLPVGSVPISDAEAQAIIDAMTTVQTVPQTVTRFQARAALHLAGLLPSVEALMADPQTDALARLAWTDAQEFRRTSPTVLSMAGALGLTDEQLDALFTTAAEIEA